MFLSKLNTSIFYMLKNQKILEKRGSFTCAAYCKTNTSVREAFFSGPRPGDFYFLKVSLPVF